MVNTWFAPLFTITEPEGVILPFAPADAVMVKVFGVKDDDIVWLAVTFVKVYVPTAPTDDPSTNTLATWYPVLAVMVNT